MLFDAEPEPTLEEQDTEPFEPDPVEEPEPEPEPEPVLLSRPMLENSYVLPEAVYGCADRGLCCRGVIPA